MEVATWITFAWVVYTFVTTAWDSAIVPVLTVVDDIATFDASVHGTASTLQRMWRTLDQENDAKAHDDESEEI